jgi:two-component system nitrate/nitrite response regulator NarL
MEPRSVFLIDKNQLFRAGIKRLLDGGQYNVVGEARALGAAEVALVRDHGADLLILEVEHCDAGLCGDLLQEVRRGRPEIKIVILTGDGSRASFLRALSWSVDGYLFKDMSPEALVRSLELIALGQQIFPTAMLISRGEAGERPFAPLVSAWMHEPPHAATSADDLAKSLTPQDLEILRALVKGHSNRTIARSLDVSEEHVKAYLRALLRKLQVKNRTQAAVWALQHGVNQWMLGPA